MDRYDIYKDIAQRTDGDIYIGVVGPVRSGKSTFITRFMESLVLPNIAGKNKKQVAVDELPQSAAGKTVMTTEPKFVPSEAVTVKFDKAQARIRLIDCVGYLVDGALGHEENSEPRLVRTPWDNEPMPFEKAAEYGTHKVICDHSTIGVVVTTDGSFTEIERANYEQAEERVINELKSINKPFIVVFNSTEPQSEKTKKICLELEKKYGVTVVSENVLELDGKKIADILNGVLMEFPLKSFDLKLPEFIQALPVESKIVSEILEVVRTASASISKMKDYRAIEKAFDFSEDFEPITDVSLNLGFGVAEFNICPKNGLFYRVLSDECGECISDEFALMRYVKDLKEAKKSYAKLKNALECAEATGYGIVSPSYEETELDKPEIVKKSGQYCVRFRANAKSLHIIRADVKTIIDPVCGTKKQCEDFVAAAGEEDCKMDTEIFGKPLYTIVNDEVSSKCESLSDALKGRFKRVVTKAVNEKKSNMICILI